MPRRAQKQVTSIQPGGGVSITEELLWGRVRRWLLKRACPRYGRRMAAVRQGSCDGGPHAVIDPRDLKYYHNLCDRCWPQEHDRVRAGTPVLARYGGASNSHRQPEETSEQSAESV